MTAWFDKCQVAVLSSNFNPNQTVTVQRWMKEAPHVKNTDMPAPIFTYNQYMGGVDLNDQLKSYYPSGHWEQSGEDTYFGSSSVLHHKCTDFVSPHQPSSRCHSLLQFNFIWPSSSSVASVEGRGTLVTKENAPPWPWHYLIFQAIRNKICWAKESMHQLLKPWTQNVIWVHS